MGLCTQCEKKLDGTCKKLCGEAEAYLNKLDVQDGIEDQSYTRTEKSVLNALARGKTRPEIAKMLNITAGNLRVVIHNLEQKALRLQP